MASALATSAQVSGRLGREAEVAEELINGAGTTEEQNEDAIFFLNFYLFIYGCVGSSFLCEGFL